ncbi:MAG TPA: glycosyl transferase family 36, partial [Casimicrobiaceae bacterium]|nr:glycosyl transferase family 36 [Casimicrobiaceae bacterium]
DTGSGFSQWRNLALTRWREDATADMLGSYVLIRDRRSGIVWSPTMQPLGAADDMGSFTLVDGCAKYAATRNGVDATLTLAVVQDSDCEMRRLTLSNTGSVARELDITSYAELVLGSATTDAAHPAFSKLFVETQWQSQPGVLIAHRRLRSPEEPSAWAAHGVVVSGDVSGQHIEYETDRARFLGRGRDLRTAQALVQSLTETTGAVLDPIFSARVQVSLAPGASAIVTFWTLAAPSRAELRNACDAVSSASECERIVASAGRYEAAVCAQIGIGDTERELFQQCVAPLFVADAHWRAPAATLLRGAGGAPALWPHGISGDRPIVLMRVAADNDAVSQLLRAQRFWQAMGVGVDVVLSNAAGEAAAASLQSTLDARVAEQKAHVERHDAPADVFAVERDVTDAFRDALATVARIVGDASTGGLARLAATEFRTTDVTGHAQSTNAANLAPSIAPTPRRSAPVPTSRAPLAFDNGVGGFDVRAREYVIRLDGDHCTPAPWINVLANPSFGCFVSAEGGGYTWSINSQQNPLTPWPNDAVTDAAHDVIYLRDDETSDVWTATANPIRARDAVYEIRHGKGYTVFAHTAHGMEVESTVCVPLHDSVRLTRLTLRNRSDRPRSMTLTAYVEWALAPNGTVASPYIATSIDAKTEALFARNAWRAEFGERVAFIDFGGSQQSASGNRATFLDGGTVTATAAVGHSAPLDGVTGIGLDPCGALRTHVTLAAGDECDLLVALGDAGSVSAAQALIAQYRAIDFDAVLQDVRAAWNDMLDTVNVRTPDAALDALVNDWLLYQTLACRVWARTAYYQASGAYGFRDQLQDVMALCVARPDVAREHLLRAASRQFVEGDVQHWWLPPAGQGLRTRMTDDRLWLPYVAARYLRVTGEDAVLDERIPFITGPALADGQQDAFFDPARADAATLYEHCARAIDVSLANGAHGLPLIGTGDWNDGMNRVGIDGRGESVWLAWFLVATIDAIAPIAQARGDSERAARWHAHAASLRTALDDTGWDGQDGEWYRRGYYDDGTPLGSRDSAECRIDAIAQSWSVMANATDRARCALAMDAVDGQLILDDARIALLFTPPFDQTTHDPGYIKGYPPGIRENGGQYTHGSIWSIFAFAGLGKGSRAHSLFALINPINHALNDTGVECYRVEPYIACADVYSVAPHVGRGGWTWYTGSAGWLYRAALEAILGFDLCGNTLLIDPCVPADWPGFEIDYVRRGEAGTTTRFTIVVDNAAGVERGVARVSIDDESPRATDGKPARVALTDDGAVHRIRVTLG